MEISNVIEKFICDEDEKLKVFDITEIEFELMEIDGISPDVFDRKISEKEAKKIETIDDLVNFLKENKK